MDKSLETELANLALQFKQEIPKRLNAITTLLANIDHRTFSAKKLNELYTHLHKLAGSSGTMGWTSLGQTANKAAQQLTKFIDEQSTDDASWHKIQCVIKDLEQLVNLPIIEPSDNLIQQKPTNPQYLVYIVDDDVLLTKALAAGLQDIGYTIREFDNPTDFSKACLHEAVPDLVLMDMDFPCGKFAGGEQLAELRLQLKQHFPTIFISQHNTMASRLTAYRAGASRYLVKPIDIVKLQKQADELCHRCGDSPFRILIVDDDEYTLQAFVFTLQDAGMVVEGISNPLKVLDKINQFSPDILLLDIYMPEASGPEIAAVIREDDSLAWLPILFLSVESDPSKHAIALAHGGDDFLVKPVQPSYLIAAIQARAWRARRNKILMSNHLPS